MESKRVLWIKAGPAPSPTWPESFEVAYCDPVTGLRSLRLQLFHAVVLEFPLSSWTSGKLLREVQTLAPGIPVFVRDPQASLSEAAQLGRLGVYEVLAPGQ